MIFKYSRACAFLATTSALAPTAMSPPAFSATLTVTNFADSGAGTLRDRIAVLSWPSYHGDFVLQSVTNIIATNSWVNVAGTPAVVAGQNVLTNGPISGNRFYRLKGN